MRKSINLRPPRHYVLRNCLSVSPKDSTLATGFLRDGLTNVHRATTLSRWVRGRGDGVWSSWMVEGTKDSMESDDKGSGVDGDADEDADMDMDINVDVDVDSGLLAQLMVVGATSTESTRAKRNEDEKTKGFCAYLIGRRLCLPSATASWIKSALACGCFSGSG